MEHGYLDIGLLLEPVNSMNYKFIRMKTKEVWGAIVHKDTKFAQQTEIRPGELVGIPVITYQPNTAVHNELVAWSGDYAADMDFSATYNALYNAVILAKEKKSVVVSLQLESYFEDMSFIPFSPKIEFSSILVWKEQVVKSTVTNIFIEYIKELYKK